MKTTIISLACILVISLNAFSQKIKPRAVWLKIENKDLVPTKVGSELKSKDKSLQTLLVKHKVKKVEYPFSNSKNPELQKVVQLTCDCIAQNLYADIVNKTKISKEVYLAPTYELLHVPNDYSHAFTNDYALNLINAPGAWDITTGSSEVVLAISDQNFSVNHEELVGKVLYYDPTNTAPTTHGTAVSTTAAGNTNNSIGKSSIGYNSSLKLYRMNFNDVLAASYAGAKVINISWASGCTFNPYVQDAVNEVWENGTFIVSAAGNGTTCGNAGYKVFPAAYNHVFSVTSIGPNNNHQKVPGDINSTHQHNDSVDICAPGYDVPLTGGPGSYFTSNGSSFAAPFVTGTVGLMLAVNPCLKNDEIAIILRETAFNIDALNPQYAGQLGAGRLDAAAAVQMAKNYGNFEILAEVENPECTPNAGRIELLNASSNPTKTYTYQWSNGSTEAILQDLANGEYTVIVNDGCKSDTASFIINANPTNLTAQVTNAQSEMSATGSINIEVYGVPLFSYLWSNGSTEEDLIGVPAGEYSVTVTNGFGCDRTVTYNVRYNQAVLKPLRN